MTHPVIGITSNYLRSVSDPGFGAIGAPDQDWALLAQDYVTAVEKAGAIPIILPAHVDFEANSALLERLDGVLLSGGHDMAPQSYGERFDPHCGMLDTPRDCYELALIRRAAEFDLPLLGICRGIQSVNVAFGGTLYQDLPSQGMPVHSIWTGDRNNGTHQVEFPEGTPLRSIFGCALTWVNSFHHQAVKEVAPCLKEAAFSAEDHLVEAVYYPGKKFFLAVQWHPEMMFRNEEQTRIFTAFAQACSSR